MCVRPSAGRPHFTSASVLASLGPWKSRRDPQAAGQDQCPGPRQFYLYGFLFTAAFIEVAESLKVFSLYP